MSNSVGFSPSSVLSIAWNSIFKPILGAITSAFTTLLNDIAAGLGTSVVDMFNNWAQSLYGLGIWAPVIFVVVLGTAGMILYLFIDAFGAEKDVKGTEEDA